MADLTSVKEIKAMVKRFGFRFRKSLGQNFLVDSNTLQKIVQAARVDKNQVVVEIGPGFGTLTVALAESAARVISIEIDPALLPVLAETLAPHPNVTVVHQDALKVDLDQLVAQHTDGRFGASGERFQVAANLPYYITTPIVMNLLENGYNFQRIVVMVQKEVGQRMMAKPGTKDYGALSVAVQYYTVPELVTNVPKHSFYPPPEIESSVIQLTKRDNPAVETKSPKVFFAVVKAAFGQRRKTLLNALANGSLGKSKEQLESILQNVGIDPTRRGETLSLQEFANIANSITI